MEILNCKFHYDITFPNPNIPVFPKSAEIQSALNSYLNPSDPSTKALKSLSDSTQFDSHPNDGEVGSAVNEHIANNTDDGLEETDELYLAGLDDNFGAISEFASLRFSWMAVAVLPGWHTQDALDLARLFPPTSSIWS
jgi:hypothetical protein